MNLENRNYTSKLIPKLILDSGEEVIKQEVVLKEQQSYYEKLYAEKLRIEREKIKEEISKLDGPKLTDDEAKALEGHIPLLELSEALKSMKNEKGPGLDGFTAEFF